MHVIEKVCQRISLRKKNERGATLVLVSLLMVALLGMAAISIDFAVASSDKSEAQNAADAAALAIARECAVQSTNCSSGAAQTEVNWAISQNSPGKTGSAAPAPSFHNREITVTVEGARSSMFAQIFGDPDLNVGAKATASWDHFPVAGPVAFPVAIGYCDWLLYKRGVGEPNNIRLFDFGKLTSGNLINPGGTDRSCTYNSPDPGIGPQTLRNNRDTMAWMTDDVLGINLFGNCELTNPSFLKLYENFLTAFDWKVACDSKSRLLERDQVIMIPIYGIGTVTIRIPFIGTTVTLPNRLVTLGFAPFQIDSFRNTRLFGLITDYNRSNCRMWSATGVLDWTCEGIRGQFIRTSRPIEGWEYGTHYGGSIAPDLGAVKVQLTN